MLGNADQPFHVEGLGSEVTHHAIIMNSGSSFLPRAAALDDGGGNALQRTQSRHTVLTDRGAHRVDQLVSDEAVAELGIIAMNIHGRVDQMRIIPVPLRYRALAPGVKRSRGETQNPARHRDRDPLTREIAGEGIHHFGFTPRPRYTAARR